MFTSIAKITSDRGSIYLQQLCKHFGHKVEVEFSPQTGQIRFPFGQCDLSADAESLTLTAGAKTQADLTKTSRVIANHLERFAFRENPEIVWHANPDTAAKLG